MSTDLWLKANTLSFKTKTTLIAIAIGITPVILTGVFSYIQVRQTVQAKTFNSLKLHAETIADKINDFVFERSGDVVILASLPILADTKISTLASTEFKAKVLKKFAETYQSYDNITVFDLQGNPLIQVKGEKQGNSSGHKYFQEALKTGKPVISEPTLVESTGKTSVFFVAPIKELTTNQVIGMVRTRVAADKFDEILRKFATKYEAYHILDRETNNIFISSNGRYKNQGETSQMKQAQQGGMMNVDVQDHSDLLSVATLTQTKGGNKVPWTAVTTINKSVAYEELQRLLFTIVAGTIFTGILSVGIATFFADRVLQYIQKAIFTITNSASEIIDSVQLQEITVNQQANTAIDTTNTINQLGDISTSTAEQAASSAAGAQTALTLAESGTNSVRQTLAGMSGLRESVDAIAAQIVNLGEQTGQITNVSDLVSNLAKQTNMLALKAAVEAARVGEQGKGFGVVAGEIRKLAEESKKSAEKISNLATDIQTSINRTVMVTDRGTKTVTEGIQLAESTAATFGGVKDAVGLVFLNSQQISASAAQQATAIQEVLGAMTLVSQGSQESAVGMHRVKTSTRELNQIADELQAVLN